MNSEKIEQYKIGDMLYCYCRIKHNKTIHFIKGKYYKIVSYDSKTNYLYFKGEHDGPSISTGFPINLENNPEKLNGYNVHYIDKYFMNIKELRKYKLQKLNEKTT